MVSAQPLCIYIGNIIIIQEGMYIGTPIKTNDRLRRRRRVDKRKTTSRAGGGRL